MSLFVYAGAKLLYCFAIHCDVTDSHIPTHPLSWQEPCLTMNVNTSGSLFLQVYSAVHGARQVYTFAMQKGTL